MCNALDVTYALRDARDSLPIEYKFAEGLLGFQWIWAVWLTDFRPECQFSETRQFSDRFRKCG